MAVVRARVLPAVVVVLGAAFAAATLAGQSSPGASPADAEWRFFGSDAGATRYSPANQINASNVGNLQRGVALFNAELWSPAGRPAMQVSPLIVDGVMYTTASVHTRCGRARCGHRAAALALAPDRRPAEMVRHHRPAGEELPAAASATGPMARGDERIFVVMGNYMLVALDAKTGRQVTSFGKNGVVDMGDEPALERAARVAARRPRSEHLSAGDRRQRPGRVDLDAYGLDAEPSWRVDQRTVADEHPGRRRGLRHEDGQDAVALQHHSPSGRRGL